MNENKDTDTIRTWMINYLAKELKVDPHSINPTNTFEKLGVDTITIMAMTGELENFLGKTLSPTLAYNYPTIEDLTRFLTSPE